MRNVPIADWRPTEREREAIQAVLDSQRLSYGPISRQFETEFAALHGCRYGVLSNSGTSSLQVALQALKELHSWRDGDEVIVPALTFVATVNVVLHNRLKPILVDINPDTYNMNVSGLERVINGRTRVLIPVHLFGQPAPVGQLLPLRQDGFSIIEDSCESVLATHWGKPVGSFGDIGCFSMYMAHHVQTGVGGMSITNNPDYAKKMRSLVNFGLDISELPSGEAYEPSMLARKFKFNSVGHSARITELEAALGLAQLPDLSENIKKRQANADYLIRGLSDLEQREILRLPHVAPGSTHSRMMFTFTVLSESKHGLMRHLSENGIGVRDAVPLLRQPCYKGLWNPDDYPVASFVDEHGLYIGCGPHLAHGDLDYVLEVIHGYFRSTNPG